MNEPIGMRIQARKLEEIQRAIEPWKDAHHKAMAAFDMQALADECRRMPDDLERLWNDLLGRNTAGLSEADARLLASRLQYLFRHGIEIVQVVADAVSEFGRKTGH